MLIKFNKHRGKDNYLEKLKVIIDSDVAELYGVETKRINESGKKQS